MEATTTQGGTVDTDLDIPSRYICKKCGAESPTGIGYVSGDDYNHTLSMGVRPDPNCPNLHVYEYDNPIWDELGYTIQARMEGRTMKAEPTTVIDLADQLGVEAGDVAVYVDQLIEIDGEDAVVVDSGDGRFILAHIGNVGGTAYNVTLTPDAVESIRLQFKTVGTHELVATRIDDAEHPVAGIWSVSIDVMDEEGNTVGNVASTTLDGNLDSLHARDAAEEWAESLHFDLSCKIAS